MKKILAILSILIIMLTASCAANDNVHIDGTEADGFVVATPSPTAQPTLEPEERDFRGMKWGMSLSDVTNAEGTGYRTVAEGVIRYNNLTVGNLPVEAEYIFEDGMLSSCIYYTTHTHEDTNEFINEYNELKKRYINKYGSHKYSEQKWGKGVSKSMDRAEAIEKGYMMYRTGWEIGNTSVNIVLFKDEDSKIKIGIRYLPLDISKKGDVVPGDDIEI